MGGVAHQEHRALLGSLERAVLDVLWRNDAAVTGRYVHSELTSTRSLAYTTVTTVLYRLTAKGLVRQARSGRAYTYAPTLTHANLVADHMSRILDACSPDDRRDVLLRFIDRMRTDDARILLAALMPGGASRLAA